MSIPPLDPLRKSSRGGKRPGSGRPPGPEKERHVAMVSPATKTWLNKMAFARGEAHGQFLDALVEWVRTKENFLTKKLEASRPFVLGS